MPSAEIPMGFAHRQRRLGDHLQRRSNCLREPAHRYSFRFRPPHRTALRLCNNAQLKLGESVVVFGAGGIGFNIIQASALVSASVIVAVDLFDSRLELAQRLGATHCINSSRDNAETLIQEMLAGQPLDVFIDNTGSPAVIEQGYRLTHAKGRVILVGVPRQGNATSLYTLPLHFGKVITGSQGGESHPQRDIPRYLRLLEQGRLQLDRFVTARYPLERINDAIAAMRDGATAGRVMLQL